jgi:hypothetical protein
MTVSGAATPSRRTLSRALPSVLLVAALLSLTVWATTAGQDEPVEPVHAGPATVEEGAHGEPAWVRFTSEAARRTGLEVTRVAGQPAALEVPYAAIIYAADGTTWVYVADPADPLRFRREEVLVSAVVEDRVLLHDGPEPGTSVAGTGAVELYGAEFEVGH